MYAVIETGGKQYRVAEGDTLEIETMTGDPGQKIEFERVLLVGGEGEPKIGKPLVEGAKVTGEILAQDRGKKLTVYKFQRRKDYRRRNGHRQALTRVKISGISG